MRLGFVTLVLLCCSASLGAVRGAEPVGPEALREPAETGSATAPRMVSQSAASDADVRVATPTLGKHEGAPPPAPVVTLERIESFVVDQLGGTHGPSAYRLDWLVDQPLAAEIPWDRLPTFGDIAYHTAPNTEMDGLATVRDENGRTLAEMTYAPYGGGVLVFRTAHPDVLLLQTLTEPGAGPSEWVGGKVTSTAFVNTASGETLYAEDFLRHESPPQDSRYLSRLCDMGDFTGDGEDQYVFLHHEYDDGNKAFYSLVSLRPDATGTPRPIVLARSPATVPCDVLATMADAFESQGVLDDYPSAESHVGALRLAYGLRTMARRGLDPAGADARLLERRMIREAPTFYYDKDLQQLLAVTGAGMGTADWDKELAPWLRRVVGLLQDRLYPMLPAWLPPDQRAGRSRVNALSEGGATFGPGAPSFTAIDLPAAFYAEAPVSFLPTLPFRKLGASLSARDRARLSHLVQAGGEFDFPCSAGPIGDTYLCGTDPDTPDGPDAAAPTVFRGVMEIEGLGRMAWGFARQQPMVSQTYEMNGQPFHLVFDAGRVAVFSGRPTPVHRAKGAWPGRGSYDGLDRRSLTFLGTQDLWPKDVPAPVEHRGHGGLRIQEINLLGPYVIRAVPIESPPGANSVGGRIEVYRITLRPPQSGDVRRREF